MPFQSKFTNDDLINFLSKDGETVTSDQVKGAAEHFGVKVQSVTKRINKLPQFQKVTRGTWNLSVAEKLERVYEGLPATPAVETVGTSSSTSSPKAKSRSVLLHFGHFVFP